MKSIMFIVITRLGGVVPQIQIPGFSTQEMSTGRTQSSCGFTTLSLVGITMIDNKNNIIIININKNAIIMPHRIITIIYQVGLRSGFA